MILICGEISSFDGSFGITLLLMKAPSSPVAAAQR
jgi:hypothetical protein